MYIAALFRTFSLIQELQHQIVYSVVATSVRNHLVAEDWWLILAVKIVYLWYPFNSSSVVDYKTFTVHHSGYLSRVHLLQ